MASDIIFYKTVFWNWMLYLNCFGKLHLHQYSTDNTESTCHYLDHKSRKTVLLNASA